MESGADLLGLGNGCVGVDVGLCVFAGLLRTGHARCSRLASMAVSQNQLDLPICFAPIRRRGGARPDNKSTARQGRAHSAEFSQSNTPAGKCASLVADSEAFAGGSAPRWLALSARTQRTCTQSKMA